MLPLNNRVFLVKENNDYAGKAASQIANLITGFADRPCLISLSGGSTPFPVYKKLARNLAESCNVENLYWMQTDERLVAANHERSNQQGIRQSLFVDGLLPQKSFFPVVPQCDDEQPDLSGSAVCQNYFARLQQLPANIRPAMPIDLLILGVGNDGHTASLFPDTDWQTRTTATGFAVFKTATQPEHRFSLTLAAIMRAREIVFLVNGSEKSQTIEQIFFAADFWCPASFIARNRAVNWILDGAAAGQKLIDALGDRKILL